MSLKYSETDTTDNYQIAYTRKYEIKKKKYQKYDRICFFFVFLTSKSRKTNFFDGLYETVTLGLKMKVYTPGINSTKHKENREKAAKREKNLHAILQLF